MNSLDTQSIGEIIRKIRKERGLRLEDLADESISPATISNLERGVPHVKTDKLYYLLEKLDVSIDEVPEFLLSEKKEQEELMFRLTAAESLRRLGKTESALKALKELDISDDHSYASAYHWLIGTCYLDKRDLSKAERSFTTAIRLASRNQAATQDNMEAYSFSDLGRCSYYRNDLQLALQYTNSGLDAFCHDGERSYIKYILLRNKAIYLERLGRPAEALKIVQDAWDELGNVDHIEHTETVLSFYWIRAEMLRKIGSLDEAIRYAQEGIQKASLNNLYASGFDLWVTLGSAYTAKKEWENAEASFNVAMEIAEETGKVIDNRFIRACVQRAELYSNQKKWAEAENTLVQAISKAKDRKCYAYLTDALLALGNLHFANDRKNEAIEQYAEARKAAKKHRFTEKEYQAWYGLANCYREIDEIEFRQCTENMYTLQRELNDQKEARDQRETVL
ncbi:tetratricopeptide repeat protein [Salinithrix halophila]|uniref:Tetratricopeptide repeat protein n=1 Tax=Salinithrix halophila TaxID=1485204 RepID=A0ABV8JBF5_9BACL